MWMMILSAMKRNIIIRYGKRFYTFLNGLKSEHDKWFSKLQIKVSVTVCCSLTRLIWGLIDKWTFNAHILGH